MTLRAVDVRHTYGVTGVDLEVVENQLTLLVGRNGSGKSTLLRILAGVLRPERGEVSLGGHALRTLPAKERARRIAFVPQDVDCPFEFTVDEFVGMGRYPHLSRFSGMGDVDREAIADAMDAVRVRAFGPRPVTELSGGQFRRVALARALATQADTLLLDEPTANLDLEHQIELLDLLRQQVADGRTVVVASHDFNLTVPAADRVVVLRDGAVFCHDEPEAALTPRTLADVFGVSSCPETGPFPRAFGRLLQDPDASRRGDDAGNSPSSS